VTARTSAGGRTLVEATLDPGSNARFSWSARESTAAVARGSRFPSAAKNVSGVAGIALPLRREDAAHGGRGRPAPGRAPGRERGAGRAVALPAAAARPRVGDESLR